MLTSKRGWWVLGGAVALAGVVVLPALADPEAIGSGNATTARVYVTGGHMMVPLEEVLGQLPGSSVEWLPAFRRAVVRQGDQVITLHTESGYAQVGGHAVVLDSPAVVRGQRLMVPAEFFRELLGVTVSYDRVNGLVTIRGGKPELMTAGYRGTQRAAGVEMPGVVSVGALDTITVRSSGAHPSLAARVQAIQARLSHAAGAMDARSLDPSGQVWLSRSTPDPTVYVGSEAVVEVSAEDARLASTSRDQLGNHWVREIRHALARAYGTGN